MTLDGQAGTRLPQGRGPWPTDRKRRFQLRDAGSRGRNAFNRLLVLLAVAATAFGGYEIWSVWDNRRTIDEACAGLVPAGQVMSLEYGGGRIEANSERIDATLHRGVCRIYSTEAGAATGTDSGVRLFFEASVGLEPEADTAVVDQGFDPLVDENHHPYLDGPVGGGIPGLVTDSGVGVKLACHGTKEPAEDGVRNVVATAVSSTDGHAPLNSGRQMNQDTRDRLADIAVATANRLGEQLGCEHRLPDPPAHVPPVQGELTAAAEADGTCAWYGGASRDRAAASMPDQVMETATDPDVWQEKCGLALSGDRASALWKAYKTGHRATTLDPPTERAELWASAQSWFGESAQQVRFGGAGTSESTPAEPGKAGRDPEAPAWWASSRCHGRPAVHTLTLSHQYGQAVTADRRHAARLSTVFRAYVEDVAERRGCTRVTFPQARGFDLDRK